LKSTRLKHLCFGLTLSLVSVVITLLLLEFGLRMFYPGIGSLKAVITQAPWGDSRSYRLYPGKQVLFTGLHDRLKKPVLWQVNAQGLRSDKPLPPKTGKFRVVTFGDSETFGWSVSLEDTFQRRMEQIDSSVEVINLGTPGYNAENIADYIEKALPGLKADFVFYLFHKNDLEGALKFSPTFASSQLYLLYKKSKERIFRGLFPQITGSRDSPERVKIFQGQADRMIEIVKRENVPLLFGMLKWRFVKTLQPLAQTDCDPSTKPQPCVVSRQAGFWSGAIDIEKVRRKVPRIDGHMPPPAHQDLAELLCRVISGDRKNSCVPN
jgi:lysophospholipase L1-like esterase